MSIEQVSREVRALLAAEGPTARREVVRRLPRTASLVYEAINQLVAAGEVSLSRGPRQAAVLELSGGGR
jgi:predicted transcriptional regulator